jgi:hypothetical protein
MLRHRPNFEDEAAFASEVGDQIKLFNLSPEVNPSSSSSPEDAKLPSDEVDEVPLVEHAKRKRETIKKVSTSRATKKRS